jgi:hypothetical protein
MRMKIFTLFFVFLFWHSGANGYGIRFGEESIIKIYSQNMEYYLVTVPHDNIYPSSRGETSVYKKGDNVPCYVFENSFDLYLFSSDVYFNKNNNYLNLSNDGETIIYVSPYSVDEDNERILKNYTNEDNEDFISISIYKKGRLIKNYTSAEITGCDIKNEKFRLMYSNDSETIDIGKSWQQKKKVFKEGIDEKEKFLNDFPVFCFDDIVYLTDSNKRVHVFDLKKGCYINSYPFEKIYEEIKGKAGFNKLESIEYKTPNSLIFPKMKNGKDTYESLADYILVKLVPFDDFEKANENFKLYRIKLYSSMSRDGHLEIEKLIVDDHLTKDKVVEFFKNNRFDGSFIPDVFGKWYLGYQTVLFRNENDELAEKEKHIYNWPDITPAQINTHVKYDKENDNAKVVMNIFSKEKPSEMLYTLSCNRGDLKNFRDEDEFFSMFQCHMLAKDSGDLLDGEDGWAWKSWDTRGVFTYEQLMGPCKDNPEFGFHREFNMRRMKLEITISNFNAPSMVDMLSEKVEPSFSFDFEAKVTPNDKAISEYTSPSAKEYCGGYYELNSNNEAVYHEYKWKNEKK